MSELNRRLQRAFLFEEIDVRANRAGRLSRRQLARFQLAGRNVALSFVVFALVMLGSAAFVGFMQIQSGSASLAERLADPSTLTVVAAVLTVAILVVGIGAVISRRYVSALSNRQFNVARGPAEVASASDNNYHIRIGPTRLRLPAEEQLQAFQPGAEYRVYFLHGPVATVLSAEVASQAEIDLRPLTPEEEAALPAPDPLAQTAGRAWVVLAALGLMALCIPVAGVLTTRLPDALRCAVFGGLLVAAILFVPAAIWVLSPRT
jgi:hypothetical protein